MQCGYNTAYTGRQFTIYFNKADGNSGTDVTKVTYWSSYPSISIPWKTGYTFGGYYDESGNRYYNSSGQSVAGTCTLSSDIVLYARWNGNQYAVYFNKADGTGGTDSTTATYGSAMPSISLPSKSNYVFNGYYDDSGVQYYTSTGASARNYDKTDYTILYARWADVVSPTISRATWVQNGSTGYYAYAYASDNIGVTKVQFPTWTNANGQDDLIWHDGSSGSWTVNGSSYNWRCLINRSNHNNEYGAYTTHVYAYDAANNSVAIAMSTVTFCLITFNGNKGSGSTTPTVPTTSVVATNGTSMPAASKPSRSGYTFQGYYDTSATTGGTQYYTNTGASARAWDKTANTTLYARWSANKYTVTFNVNATSGVTSVGTTSTTATFDAAMPSITVPKRTDYFFYGYIYQSTGNDYYTTTGTSRRKWDIASNATLYANWEEKLWIEDESYYSSSLTGQGTLNNPYLITSEKDFAYLAYTSKGETYSGKYFKQTANLNLNAHPWIGIGVLETPFAGIYDGGLYQITGLRMRAGLSESNFGLFAYATGTVRNVELKDINIRTSGSNIGGLIGNATNATIENCVMSSLSIYGFQNVGTFVGYMNGGTIKNCSSKSCRISGTSYLGGIAGCATSNVSVNDVSIIDFYGGDFSDIFFGSKTSTVKLSGCYGNGEADGNTQYLMYGGATAWTNWSLVSDVNGGLPVQKGLYHIGGFTGSQEVYNYLTTHGYTVQN